MPLTPLQNAISQPLCRTTPPRALQITPNIFYSYPNAGSAYADLTGCIELCQTSPVSSQPLAIRAIPGGLTPV